MFFQILFNSNNSFIVNLISLVIVVTALIFSLVMHELGHAYAALWSGDKTAKINGRLSLNPLKHLDPLGFLMLVFMGFGYAKPVPVNPLNFKNRRRGMFFVSIAGVTVNIILAFIASGFYVSLLALETATTFTIIMTVFFECLMYYNLILLFFNLLPLFPLDGFRLVESILGDNHRIVDFLRRYSMYILIILVALGVITDRFDVNASWWQYFDLLGFYLRGLAKLLSGAFSWFWQLII